MKLLKDLNQRYSFIMDMEVRDYELDAEQIVNNANYLHYMEHTRHKFCQAAGMTFIEMHRMGLDGVVRKTEIEYLSSLRSGDAFLSCLRLERKGARFLFHQDILRPDGTLVVRAVVTVVIVREGKLTRGDEVAAIFKPYL